MNSLVITNIYGSPEDIKNVLYNHYKSRIIRNFLTMFISSSSMLGQMNLIAHDLGTGFKDFYYMPKEGLVDGPLEAGKGLVFGTASLFGNTAKGAIGFGSRFVNTISKSLLFLTDDDEYIQQREKMEKPSNILTGFAYGLKSTVTGVASGVKGIVVNPIDGYK